MYERIGSWIPSEWPSVGDEKIMPEKGKAAMGIVIEVVEGSHIVIDIRGKRYKGYPRVIRRENTEMNIWDYEEAPSAS